MPQTITVTRARFDFKYDEKTWKSQFAETFQKATQRTIEYTVADGQVIQTRETLWEFADALAGVSSDPVNGPPYFFFDKTFRKDAAYQLQKTHIKTTTYDAFTDTSYLVTVEDFDVLNGTITRSVSIVDGKAPLATTRRSRLSNLRQKPVVGILVDPCDFVPSKKALELPWAENKDDMDRATKRQMQRDTAIVRRIKKAMNPLMKIGQTARVIDESRGIDGPHLLVARSFTVDPKTGSAEMTQTFEYWVR